jgi:cysteine desulfurase/selenocysteine lyase
MFRSDFPIFENKTNLVFLDSASSAQKPQKVIEAMSDFFANSYANIHRGAYDLSMDSSLLYERAKEKVAQFLGADSYHEIVFTYNATYAFNLIARSLVKTGILGKWDTVLLTKADHHANIVPWQILAEEYGIVIEWVDLHADGTIDYADLEKKIPHAKVVSISGASNVTGEVLDLDRVKRILDILDTPLWGGDARRAEGDSSGTISPPTPPHRGAFHRIKPLFILDGSQRFPHMETDVQKYGIDIFVGTGHKVMSDTGIGFFYARRELLKTMIPAFCGGGAINHVSLDGYAPAGLPFRHEPGTPHIAGAVSLLAALEYIESIGGFTAIEKYEQELVEYTLQRLDEYRLLHSPEKGRCPTTSLLRGEDSPDSVANQGGFAVEDRGVCSENSETNPSSPLIIGASGIRILGSHKSKNRLGVFSFVFENHHPNDIAEMLADEGICVRSWHHCTEPLHNFFGIGGSVRMSLYIYNTKEDIDRFFEVLMKVVK